VVYLQIRGSNCHPYRVLSYPVVGSVSRIVSPAGLSGGEWPERMAVAGIQLLALASNQFSRRPSNPCQRIRPGTVNGLFLMGTAVATAHHSRWAGSGEHIVNLFKSIGLASAVALTVLVTSCSGVLPEPSAVAVPTAFSSPVPAVDSPTILVTVQPTVAIDVEGTVTARLAEERKRVPATTPEPALSDEARVAAKILPSVVRLTTDKAMGTGLVVGDGLVITNRHVVGDISRLTVQTGTGQQYSASVAAKSDQLDLALLQFAGVSVPKAGFADLSKAKPGEPVLAVGYPLDLKGDASVTRGLLSAIRIGEPAAGEWVQTDAAVNPGNSGGPLVNMRGEVVGLVTFGTKWDNYTPVEGINFALSATSIRDILPALRLSVGLLPKEAAPASSEIAAEISTFLQHYDETQMAAFSSLDPSLMKSICSPALFSDFSASVATFKQQGTRPEAKLIDFQLRSVFTMPDDVFVADVFEVWNNKVLRDDRVIFDQGDKELPQITVVKRTPEGWKRLAVHVMETTSSTSRTAAAPTAKPQTPMIPSIPVADPVRAVELYYAYLNGGRYVEAYGLMGPSIRAASPWSEFITWFTNKLSITVGQSGLISRRGNEAEVIAIVWSSDRINGEVVNRQYRERWRVVLEEGNWRLNNLLETTVLPSR